MSDDGPAETGRIELRFPELSTADANALAEELRRDLRELVPGLDVERVKDDPTTQDFGATLILILGTQSVIAIARGIEAFLARRRAKLEIASDGTVVFRGDSSDAVKVVEALQGGAPTKSQGASQESPG